ncbi:MAG: hypothetical protein ABEJ02_02150 [Candidatus Paceibacteria bacterium]
MNDKKFSEFVYEIENWMDEFVIAFLSFGAIVVFIDLLFFQSRNYSFMTFGDQLYPWIVMLALMIIGRELWLLNRNLNEYMEER